ncbi:cupredoxin domain-containing protein [Bacillus sp. FJAT-27445]|uniref:cupredoxin domain-containing protein n=1 Tax=Bacillus sp. FJAT-27445 TaxID=1679166 RepID=UPI0007440373|nr:cupredoxin domain-containing protein [Bacillus sp. FJAT-27445]
MQIWTIRKGTAILILAAVFALVAGVGWWLLKAGDDVVFNETAGKPIREIHMVTGEFAATLPDGKKIEAYRWDPGTIFMEKGEKVQLIIYGVNGKEHPFHIENTTIKGIVKKGEETVVDLSFKKEGIYRLICEVHPDKERNGPMIAYIVVD